MVSFQMKQVIKGLLYTRELSIKRRVSEHRQGLELMNEGLKLPDDVKFNRVTIDGVPAGWFKVPESRENKIILFFHGGAYIAGSIGTSKYHSVYFARVCKTQLLNVEYRLAPESPFPAALEDSIKAYKWLIEEKNFSPKDIIIMGVSAGGGLTVATLLKLRDLGIELPAAGVCISPWVDLAFTGETVKERGPLDPFLTLDDLQFEANLYMGNNDPKNPYISPVYANLQGLPPLFINAGTHEILYDDALRLEEQAKKAGVDVQLDVWEEMIHAFPAFVSVAPESREAVEKIGVFCQSILK